VTSEVGGAFVIAWASIPFIFDPTGFGIVGHRIDPFGVSTGTEFSIYQSGALRILRDSPKLAADPAGGFLVTWQEGGTVFHLRESEGLAVPTSAGSADPHVQSSIAAIGDAGFVVVWGSQDFLGGHIAARWFDEAGEPVSDDIVVSQTPIEYVPHPDVAADALGNVVVTWRDADSQPRMRFYGPDQSARGAEASLPYPPARSRYPPAVALTPEGFIAVWIEHYASGAALAGRTFSADGAPGPRFQIGTGGSAVRGIDVAVDELGVGVVTWLENGVHTIQIDARSGVAGAPITIDQFEPFFGESAPTVAAGLPGSFLVTWLGRSADVSTAVRARLLTLCGNGTKDSGEECDDGNRRNGDCCSAACALEAIPGGICWRLRGTRVARFSASPTIDGKRLTCTARCRSAVEDATLILLDDGTYRWPGAEVSCSEDERRLLSDEVGRQRGRSKRIQLLPSNVRELRKEAISCTGTRIRSIRTTIRRTGEGATLTGVQRVKIQQLDSTPDGTPIDIESTYPFCGVHLGAGMPPVAPPVKNTSIPLCTDGIRLKCEPR
jgi:cysteine-rich repeat protein